MQTWALAVIWILVSLIGVGGVVFLFTTDKKVTFKFIIAFVISLIGIMFLLNLSSNDFIISFIIAIVISFIYVKDA